MLACNIHDDKDVDDNYEDSNEELRVYYDEDRMLVEDCLPMSMTITMTRTTKSRGSGMTRSGCSTTTCLMSVKKCLPLCLI